MIKVFLREKKILGDKRSLYLDFYPPIVHPETKKLTRRDHLRLYIFAKPKTEVERNHNKETKMLGENIRAQRQLELQAGSYGFEASINRKKNFVEYFEKVCESKKNTSRSNYGFFMAILGHLKTFAGPSVRADAITETFCTNFKDYLQNRSGLSHNSAAAYFDIFKSVIRGATDQRILYVNPAKNVKGLNIEDTQREYLSLAELKRLSVTPIDCEPLRSAVLFSALTGLRYSDIAKLTWREVAINDEQGPHVRFRQKKTRDTETLPISDEAFAVLGERGEPDERVFTGFRKWHCSYYLPKWIEAAGIDKNVTFHCFRHTFATLQLTLGTDIYTVSKMLGHKDVQTTQIYAKIIDEKKREAANRITLKNLKKEVTD